MVGNYYDLYRNGKNRNKVQHLFQVTNHQYTNYIYVLYKFTRKKSSNR